MPLTWPCRSTEETSCTAGMSHDGTQLFWQSVAMQTSVFLCKNKWLVLSQLMSQSHRQQTDAEVSLAQALAARQHCLLVFSSPTCRLCNSLAPDIAAAHRKYSNSLQVACINASNDMLFAPEVHSWNCISHHPSSQLVLQDMHPSRTDATL